MQNDEMIWQVIGHFSCSFRVSTKLQGKDTQNFCQNKHNVTGLCNRSSCPLANSRYATILEEKGRCYLYMKTIERAHTPKKLWQKVKLNRNYAKALEQIDSHLQYWPNFLVHKNKQRLTKITQYLIRMKRLALKVRPKIVTVPARKEKVERKREAKAEAASNVDREIEKELLQRLQNGTYGDIYNIRPKVLDKVLEENEKEDVEGSLLSEEEEEEGGSMSEGEEESFEMEEEDEDEEEEEDITFVEGYDYLEDSDIESLPSPLVGDEADDGEYGGDDDDEEEGKDEDGRSARDARKRRPSSSKRGGKKSLKKPRKNIEVEYEEEPAYRERQVATDY